MEYVRNRPSQLIIPIAAGALAGFISFGLLFLSTKWAVAFLAGGLLFVVGIFSKDRHKYLLILLALSFPFALLSTTLFKRIYFGTPGVNIGLIEVLIFIFYVRWMFSGRFTKEISTFARTNANYFALIYIFFASLSYFGATDKGLWVFGIIAIFKAYLLFVFIANNITDNKQIESIVTFMVVGIIIQSMLGITQYVTKVPIGLSLFGENTEVMMMTFGGQAFPRIAGTLLHPNQLSTFLGLQIPIAFSFLLIAKRDNFKNVLYSIGIILGVITIMLTFSRTGWVNLATSTVVVLILTGALRKVSKSAWFYLSILGALATIVLIVFSENIYLRLTQSDPILVSMRFDMIRVAWRMIGYSPIFGIGINNYVNVLPQFNSLGVMTAPVHNLYFMIAAEAGVLGLFTWLIFVFNQIRLGWRQIFSNDPVTAALMIGLLAGMVGFLVDGLSDFSYLLPSTFYLFWTLMGIFIAIRRIGAKEDSQ